MNAICLTIDLSEDNGECRRLLGRTECGQRQLGSHAEVLAPGCGVTPEMAVRLGKLCGTGPGLWLRMQQVHDLWQAEQAVAEVIVAIPTSWAPAA